MKLRALMVVNAIVAGLFGIAFVIIPGQSLAQYGFTADPALELMFQLLGAAFIGFGVLTWAARNATDSEARRAILLALFVGDFIGFVICLIAQLGGFVNSVGWSSVAIYLLLALGWGYFRFLKPGEAAPAETVTLESTQDFDS
jgi:hypothetical protein